MTDQVCESAAASPARYRASTSAMPPSMLSIELDTRRDQVSGVDFNDVEHLGAEFTGIISLVGGARYA